MDPVVDPVDLPLVPGELGDRCALAAVQRASSRDEAAARAEVRSASWRAHHAVDGAIAPHRREARRPRRRVEQAVCCRELGEQLRRARGDASASARCSSCCAFSRSTSRSLRSAVIALRRFSSSPRSVGVMPEELLERRAHVRTQTRLPLEPPDLVGGGRERGGDLFTFSAAAIDDVELARNVKPQHRVSGGLESRHPHCEPRACDAHAAARLRRPDLQQQARPATYGYGLGASTDSARVRGRFIGRTRAEPFGQSEFL